MQLLHINVAKVDRDVAHIVMAIHVCCKTFIRNVSSIFQIYVAIAFYLDVAYVSQRCCKSLFKMFHPFQTHVSSVLSGCFICFTHMLHAFVPNISSVSHVCCSKFFLVLQVFSHYKR
jgi:hypothetical protein